MDQEEISDDERKRAQETVKRVSQIKRRINSGVESESDFLTQLAKEIDERLRWILLREK